MRLTAANDPLMSHDPHPYAQTDDQDVKLGSMDAMPRTKQLLQQQGLTFGNGFVNTPVCCPSRAELLTGRYGHNVIGEPGEKDTCMFMATATDQWKGATIAAAIKDQGLEVKTGLFGKYLNSANQFCGDNVSPVPPGWDRFYATCDMGTYFNNTWNDDGVMTKTGSAYMTAAIGNQTIAWLREVARASSGGEAKTPFFAFVAPHAPHIADDAYAFITQPAPWYETAALPSQQAPRTPSFGIHAPDHHWIIANQANMTEESIAWTDSLYRSRQRSLLSVDDLVAAIVDELDQAGALDDTVIFYTSDHGYALGQLNQPSGKWNVYDHITNVPFFVRPAGGSAGREMPDVVSLVDVAPTILQLLGGDPTAFGFDGRSFAPLIQAPVAESANDIVSSAPAQPRDTALIEYWGLGNVERGLPQSRKCTPFNGRCDCKDLPCEAHLDDASNNTFIGLRIVNSTVNALYAEWYPSNAERNFTGTPTFREYYDLRTDAWQITNAISSAPTDLLEEMRNTLHEYVHCKGSSCP